MKGIVLIDEIESHLHLGWQVNIIPLLKKLFPNTTFYITTHSPIVISQLEEGEAYQLKRDADGVVRSQLISAPNKAAMVDVLKDAFGIDLNRIKLDHASPEKQQQAKQDLLDLLNH
ncbi:MAG: AAA family ATPase [Gammaproteobacteria bacterium]|nr:AAA family ATPase [Gammaproteobacteria bacterium]